MAEITGRQRQIAEGLYVSMMPSEYMSAGFAAKRAPGSSFGVAR